jgi:hypothetical protein
MKLSTLVKGVATTSATMLIAVVFSANVLAAEEAKSSGFLDASVEAKLKKTRLDDKREVMRWFSPDLNKKNYHSIMVDRVILYPAPNPGPEISSSTLDAIVDHLTAALRKRVGEKMQVVDKAGPGVLRMQPALTSVGASKKGLSAMDIIPVHLLFTAASSASGNADMIVSAHLEARITDSVSGEVRAAAKMDLKGKNLKNDKQQVTLENLQKVLDQAATDGADSISGALAE